MIKARVHDVPKAHKICYSKRVKALVHDRNSSLKHDSLFDQFSGDAFDESAATQVSNNRSGHAKCI